jgi:hypothetical protein
MPLVSPQQEPAHRPSKAALLASILLLATLAASALGFVGWCAVARDPVLAGPFMVAGPGCQANGHAFHDLITCRVAGWLIGNRYVYGATLAEVGPFTLYRVTRTTPAP